MIKLIKKLLKEKEERRKVNKLKLFHPYLTKNNKVVIPFSYSSINGIVYCYMIYNCYYMYGNDRYIGMVNYFCDDGSYPNNENYDIVKELTKFSKEYKREKDLIEKSIKYIKENPDIVSQFSIIYIE